MSSFSIYSSDELIRYIEAAGESTNIDAKGPVKWDGNETSACLTKDILALANCRDGGVIVIGKSEPQPGKFVLDGVSDDQAASFETTKVATWVNNHGVPHVHLVCYRQVYDGKQFIVIAVSEFHDVPVICSKQFEVSSTGKTAKVVLRKGTVYVRTANAESAPLSSVEEIRQLIGLATTKRTDQMLGMFQAMMKGQPLLKERPHDELFEAELETVQSDLEFELDSKAKFGAWNLVFHPVRYQEDRWDDSEALKAVLERSIVRLRSEFPPIDHNMHVREWGICNSRKGDAFGLTRSGLFVCKRLFLENDHRFINPWQPNPDIDAGKWLDFKRNLAVIIEFFVFLSRYAHNIEVGEVLAFEISASPLVGRQLVSADGRVQLDPTDQCRSERFRYKKAITAEKLRAGWEAECVKTLHGFFELFPGHHISKETLANRVEQFKNRQF